MATKQVVIHHRKAKLEATVPESTAANLMVKGWKAGPLSTKKETN